MDQTAPAGQAVLGNLVERGEDPDMDRRVGLRVRGDYQKTSRSRDPDHPLNPLCQGDF